MSAPTMGRPGNGVFSPVRAQIPQRTLRTDRWWVAPLWTDLGLAAFVIYATVRAFWAERVLGGPVPLPDAVLLPVCQRLV